MHEFLFSGAVLAGGRSLRMGRDKAFLKINGITLVARQAARLHQVGVRDLLISGRPGVDYAIPGARVVMDAEPEAGPLAGLSAVIKAAKEPWVLVLAVDLPQVTQAALQILIQAGGGRVGAVPRGEQGYEPLVAILPRSIEGWIDEALKRREFGLQSLLATAERKKLIESVPVSSFAAGTFANWNTPGDTTGNLP